MQSPDESENSDPDILAARGKVELAKAELESRLYQAGDTGRRALTRMAGKAKPIAIVAAALVGVVVVARLFRSRANRRRGWVRPAAASGNPSLFRVALGAAVRGAVRVLVARMAEQAAARLLVASDEQEVGAGELVVSDDDPAALASR
ncbi:MAG TPA: hypothetical protein VFZ53_09680 [Polyangiaceae bacterium]